MLTVSAPMVSFVDAEGGVLICLCLFSFLDFTSVAGVGTSWGDVADEWLRNEQLAEPAKLAEDASLENIGKGIPILVSLSLA